VHAPKEYSELSVWDRLEVFEDEYAIERFPKNLEYRDVYLNSARTSMVFVVALPKELSVEKQKLLVDEFTTQHFLTKSLIVSYAIYNDETNPHAQLQVSRRCVNDDGTFSWAKNREMCSKKTLLETRTFWADLTNKYLEADGFDARVTEKSFSERGIDADPTRHRGRISSEKLRAQNKAWFK
jgi:anion-transporting  ArsA/GET3 family ATPase